MIALARSGSVLDSPNNDSDSLCVIALARSGFVLDSLIMTPIHLVRSLKGSKVAVQSAAVRYNLEANPPH